MWCVDHEPGLKIAQSCEIGCALCAMTLLNLSATCHFNERCGCLVGCRFAGGGDSGARCFESELQRILRDICAAAGDAGSTLLGPWKGVCPAARLAPIANACAPTSWCRLRGSRNGAQNDSGPSTAEALCPACGNLEDRSVCPQNWGTWRLDATMG